MPTTKYQGFTREDLMHILKGMNIDLSPNTKLNAAKLETCLDEALDAAQRFSNIFPDIEGGIDLSDYRRWKRKTPVVDAFTRRTWGAIFQDNRIYEDQRQLAFARINQLIPDIGKEMDKKKIAFVVLKDGVSLKALVIKFFSVYEIDEKTPLVLINYASVTGKNQESLEDVIADFTPEEQRGRAYQMSDMEQNLFVRLLSLNRKHLSPTFKIPEEALDERCKIGFILPIGSPSTKDIARLSRISGCILCGETTHNTCSACLTAQYCSKECQRDDWKSHKALCKAIASGKWYTVTLESNPFSAMMSRMYKTSINRYDDPDDVATNNDADGNVIPPNYYEDDHYLVKIQVPLGDEANQMLVHDRYKTFELHLSELNNTEAFSAAIEAVGYEPKMYRWARREGDWEWKICFDRAPDRNPTW
ncbi:hypothetical protein P691DRAFT_779487 [Macrolepiota fuliginosa MF-IS2]|uniref:MYND-type domain-containing protein n=1 Tax=Macrolepiota fuliginosa MF-IS2 TaxID=1400762 RepID=A0A9P5X0I2_9AGAR|nr:hypothetical protein P691DRAFT_779487 [Macrolepiota fuliginosa MF-IS2]